jgi:Flp pilus assembly protein TadD
MIAGRIPSLMWIIRSAGSILAHADKRGISRNDGSRGMGTDTAKAWFEEGRRRQGAGDAAGAVEAYRRSLDLFPAAAGPATNLAGLLADANRLEEAEAVLRRTARAGGADLPLLLNLGEVLRLAGRHGEAVEAVRLAWERAPGDPDVRALHAAILRAGGARAQAMTVYRKLLAVAPDHAGARTNLADMLREDGDPAGALALIRPLAHRPDASEAVRHTHLMSLFDTGDVAGATAAGRRILKDKHARALAGYAASGLPSRVDRSAANPEGHNVIAFSLFGAVPCYLEGAIANVALAKDHYPGWTCRFHCDGTVPAEIRERLVADGAEVVMVPDAWRTLHGAVWRYFVADDRTVRRFISRDCDNRINGQERWAVERWLASDRSFHLMRDHPYHADLILANMWGGFAGVMPPLETLLRAFPLRRTDRWSDQVFAAAAIWPQMFGDVLIHDSVWAPLFGAEPFDPAVMLARPDHVGRSFR